jgi:hypothetical protein
MAAFDRPMALDPERADSHSDWEVTHLRKCRGAPGAAECGPATILRSGLANPRVRAGLPISTRVMTIGLSVTSVGLPRLARKPTCSAAASAVESAGPDGCAQRDNVDAGAVI